jgi:hypothetical protein
LRHRGAACLLLEDAFTSFLQPAKALLVLGGKLRQES